MIQGAKVMFIGGASLLALVFVSALARNTKASHAGADTPVCLDPEVYSQVVANRLKDLENRNDVSDGEVRRAYAVYRDVLGRTEAGRRALAAKNLQAPVDDFAAASETVYSPESDAEPAWMEQIRAIFPPWWDQPSTAK